MLSLKVIKKKAQKKYINFLLQHRVDFKNIRSGFLKNGNNNIYANALQSSLINLQLNALKGSLNFSGNKDFL